jgi:pimeloyl-ACP methyl ester carboxylesterase
MPSIRLGSLHTRYEVIGQGPRTLLMVQGLGLDGATWGTLAQLLAQHYKVVTFDARGAGLAQDDGAPIGTEQMAHDVLALCQALKLQRPVLLGFSMGGMVVQHAAAIAPQAWSGLILLSSVLQASARSAELLAVWRDMVAAGVSRSLVLRNQLLWANQTSFYATEGALATTLDYVLGLPQHQGPQGFVRQANACIAHDGRAACAQISLPALVMVGVQEQVFSVPEVKALAGAIAGAQYVCLPSGGHNAWLEYPEAVAAAVQAFIAMLPSAA